MNEEKLYIAKRLCQSVIAHFDNMPMLTEAEECLLEEAENVLKALKKN